ncbi:uncharacterized protein [Macrobrachium rosenbergii]|uniref:uncharacterized protein isoform X2 n=1 Tax=Macrobrachium rosenbergii TaxID=79674 RepID=UPI0034D403E8
MAPIQVHPQDEDHVTTPEGGTKKDEEGDEVKDDDEGKEADETQLSKKKGWTPLSKCSFLDVVEALVALVFCLLSIACVLVAVIYINYCKTDGVNFLCAWLIVHGICILSAMTSIVFWRDHKRTSPSATFAATGSYLLALILISFSTLWLIIGNVIVWLWWGLGWNDDQPCYEQMLKFSVAIVVVFDCSWFLTAILSVTQVVKGRCCKEADNDEQDAKGEEEQHARDDNTGQEEQTEAPLDNRTVTGQYFRSLFCPVNKRVTWQSCVEYSTLMLYFIMSVISLVIGAIYENRCPNTKLPLWLLIQAVCTIISTITKVCCRIRCQAMTNSTRNFLIFFFPMTVLLIFQVAWLAIGNDWAFHAWRHEKLILTGSSNSTESTEFAICDQRLYIFFCCIVALFDIPVMVFILLVIAMTIVLIFYFASPGNQDNLCGKVNKGKDLGDQTNDDREEGKEQKTPTDVHVNIKY